MIARIMIYIGEMFPAPTIVGNILTAIAVELVYLRLNGVSSENNFRLIFPALTLTLIALLLRIMDEFKDYQDDLKNFPQRPLPSGRVKHQDLKVLGWICVVMIIFLSSTSINLLLWAILTLIFTALMLKWFFIESVMRKSLPLAFITHHPIVLFNFVYLMLACQQLYPQVGWEKAHLIIPLCLIFTNWEISRKIRAPEQETAYTTYSKIMGPRVATALTIVLQLIFNITMMIIFKKIATPMWFQIIYVVLQSMLTSCYLKFLYNFKTSKPLKVYSEAQVLSVIGFLFIATFL